MGDRRRVRLLVLLRAPFRSGCASSCCRATPRVRVRRDQSVVRTGRCCSPCWRCSGWHAPRHDWGRVGAALALLAFVSLAGAGAGHGDRIEPRRGQRGAGSSYVPRADDRRRVDGCRRRSSGASAIAAATCLPPSDFVSFSLGIPSTPFAGLSATRFAASAAGVWRGLFPIPLWSGRWNTNALDHLPAHRRLQAAVAVGIVVVVTRRCGRARSRRHALPLVGLAGLLAFSVVVVLPDRSHYAGAFFMLFLACVWCEFAPPGARHGARAGAVAGDRLGFSGSRTVIFVAQVVATFAILPYASMHPFVPDRTLAEVAAARGMSHRIVSGQDYDGVTMAGYLDAPVYSVARQGWIRYFHNDQREADGNWHMTDRVLRCTSAAACGRCRGKRRRSSPTDRLCQSPGFRRIASVGRGCACTRSLPAAPWSSSARSVHENEGMTDASDWETPDPDGGSGSSRRAPTPSTRNRSCPSWSGTSPAPPGCSTFRAR